MRATDPDVDRNSHIRYSLMGQFADDGTFVINEHTGEIFATRALDRDPPGLSAGEDDRRDDEIFVPLRYERLNERLVLHFKQLKGKLKTNPVL